ncbi:Serine/threonine-protein kinase [Ceratobasidium sp. AG-Ba]|nr:Serine/threonine-protein kinase [Ceratobasidium sp. AG-Ba]
MHHRISRFFRDLTGSSSSDSQPSSRSSSPKPSTKPPVIQDPAPKPSTPAPPVDQHPTTQPPLTKPPSHGVAVFAAATAHAVPNFQPHSTTSTSAPSVGETTSALLSLSANCALSLASVAAELAPVPYIGPVVNCLTFVFQAIEKSKVNKEQWLLLQGRCVMVMRIAGSQVSTGGGEHYPGVTEATQHLKDTILKIATSAHEWNEANVFVAFVQFNEISELIKHHFSELDSCLRMFSYAADVAQSQWIGEFNAVQELELAKLEELRKLMQSMDMRLDLLNQNQETVLQITKENRELLMGVVNEKHKILQNQDATVAHYVEAESIVQIIRTVTDIQLPPNLLVGRQCILDNPLPIRSGVTCDVFSASFLTTEKVAKKVFRVGTSERDAVNRYAERFIRDAQLWSTFKCDYTLQFYGVGMEAAGRNREAWQLYMVSPMMKNFDAVAYLKKYRNNPNMQKGIMRIITDAAEGLKYLHGRNPPVVHSGMRGDNILITDSGGGIIGGFGLTKVLATGEAPPAVMTGRTDSYRWMAPEMLSGDQPTLQTPSDVWSWAMAALELISGRIPYHRVTQPWEVMLKIHSKTLPVRADYPDFEKYALQPDGMWALLEKCWATEPKERPTIDGVLADLRKMDKGGCPPTHEA